MFIPGAEVWRTHSGSRGRLGFAGRLPILARLILLLFFPHMVMAVGVLGFGLFALVAWPFGWVDKDAHPGIAILMIVSGAIFTPFTTLMQFGRTGIVFDKHRSEVRTITGLLFLPFLPMLPFKRRIHPLEKVKLVTLVPHGQMVRGRIPCKVKVEITGAGAVDVADCRDITAGRRVAEEVAGFLNVALEDSTGSEPSRRAPGELDVPLVCRKDAAAPPEVPRPADCAAQVRIEPGRVVAHLPAPPFKPLRPAAALLLSGLLFAAGTEFDHKRPVKPQYTPNVEYSPNDPPPPSLWPWRIQETRYWLTRAAPVVGALGAVVSFLILLGLLFLRRPSRTLHATNREIALISRYLGIPRRRTIRIDDLEELRVEGDPKQAWQLSAISDARILRFGTGLPRRELDYLCALVWNAAHGRT